MLKDFCQVIGCGDAGLAAVDMYNRAVLQEQLELVDALNRALAALPFHKQIAYRSGFLPLCADVLGGSPFKFPRAAAQAAFEAYKPVNTWLRETRDPGGPPLFFHEDFSDYPIEARNDRAYTIEQLLELSAAIRQRLGERSPNVPTGPDGADRAALVEHIVASFIDLHGGEV